MLWIRSRTQLLRLATLGSLLLIASHIEANKEVNERDEVGDVERDRGKLTASCYARRLLIRANTAKNGLLDELHRLLRARREVL